MAAGPSLGGALHFPASVSFLAPCMLPWDRRLAWQPPALNGHCQCGERAALILSGCSVRFAQEVGAALAPSWFDLFSVHPVPSGNLPADCRCPWQSLLGSLAEFPSYLSAPSCSSGAQDFMPLREVALEFIKYPLV